MTLVESQEENKKSPIKLIIGLEYLT